MPKFQKIQQKKSIQRANSRSSSTEMNMDERIQTSLRRGEEEDKVQIQELDKHMLDAHVFSDSVPNSSSVTQQQSISTTTTTSHDHHDVKVQLKLADPNSSTKMTSKERKKLKIEMWTEKIQSKLSFSKNAMKRKPKEKKKSQIELSSVKLELESLNQFKDNWNSIEKGNQSTKSQMNKPRTEKGKRKAA